MADAPAVALPYAVFSPAEGFAALGNLAVVVSLPSARGVVVCCASVPVVSLLSNSVVMAEAPAVALPSAVAVAFSPAEGLCAMAFSPAEGFAALRNHAVVAALPSAGGVIVCCASVPVVSYAAMSPAWGVVACLVTVLVVSMLPLSDPLAEGFFVVALFASTLLSAVAVSSSPAEEWCEVAEGGVDKVVPVGAQADVVEVVFVIGLVKFFCSLCECYYLVGKMPR